MVAPGLTGNGVACILITRDDRIWFEADNGLYEYREGEQNPYLLYSEKNTEGTLPVVSIKSLFEDDRGDIWIGTWEHGLFRYESTSGRFLRYPKMNELNSAHVVFQDSRKNIWVGTWRGGLTLLKDAYQPEKTSWVTFRYDEKNPYSVSDDIIYAISEDPNTHALWVGTRKGLSILPQREEYTPTVSFENYYPADSEHSISSDEVASLLCDRQGLMWLGMIGGGVNIVNTHVPDFEWDRLPEAKRLLKTSSVRSLFVG